MSSIFAAPLGLQEADDVVASISLDIDLPEWDVKRYTNIKKSGVNEPNRAVPDAVTPGRRFEVSTELIKMQLAQSTQLSIEPLDRILESLREIEGIDGNEFTAECFQYIPRFLDYFPDDLRVRDSTDVKRSTRDRVAEDVHGLTGLSLDSLYKEKKAENVESSTTVAAATGDSVPSTPAESQPVAAVAAAVVKTTAEGGVSVAHSPCAYDLSGFMPWSNYSTEGFKPLSPMDVRYHRVHLCSPNADVKSSASAWPVYGVKQVDPPEVPPDGSCPFRTSSQLSLRDSGGEFVLMESVEQLPVLMHSHGMSGTIMRYFRSSLSSPDAKQISHLGPVGHLVKLDSEFLPRAYGGNSIKIESTCCIFESSLLRAPIVRHNVSKTDFLLVRSRMQSKAEYNCVLRPIRHLYVVGQAEPSYRVDVPVVPRLHQVLAARVQLECRRFWLRAKQLPSMDFVNRMFIGERRSLLNRYLGDAVRDLQMKPGLAIFPTLAPEEACVIDAMKEGIRRLAERGIERIFAISPMRIRNYVRDIEVFERSMPSTSRTPRIAHLCAQLENEMRLSPWNLSNDYWDVMTGKRGAMFQFSPLGDPSGGRGEGLSFRKVLKTEAASAASVLSSISGSQRTANMEIEEIRSKSKKDLIEELQKLNVPERVWKSMSRWQLMRQLALLLGLEDDSEERLAPWKRKALHADKIMEAWKKQMKAISDPRIPEVSQDEMIKALRAYEELGVRETVVSGNVSPTESPPDSDSGDDDLAGMILDDLKPSDAMHDMLLQDLQGGDSVEKPKITRLEIVSTGRTKSTGNPWSQVTYVYGKRNIALYRKWKELEEEGGINATPAQSPVSGEAPQNYWQAKVEMTLKVHRKFQRMIKQAAEAGRSIPDCKRCGACHLFGHDQTFDGCPVYVMDMAGGGQSNLETNPVKRKKINEQSPTYE